ncbi:MAG: hypothetical protein WA052_02335 [Microgenomates group bacterium]
MIDLSSILNEKIESVENSIKHVAFERDNSATPMESQHDQTRQVANQLYNSLLEEKRSIQQLKRRIGEFQTIYDLLNLSNGTRYRFFIVPDGLGGITIDGITLISEDTPLSKIIIGKEVGFEYELNGHKFKIEKVQNNT